MWYVIDKNYGIVMASSRTRAEAYDSARYIKFMNPDRKFKVARTFV